MKLVDQLKEEKETLVQMVCTFPFNLSRLCFFATQKASKCAVFSLVISLEMVLFCEGSRDMSEVPYASALDVLTAEGKLLFLQTL